MHLWLRSLGVSVFTLISTLLTAQPFGFSLPVINNVFQGAIINPAFSVTNFDSVTSLQFVLLWDPTILEFQEVYALNLNHLEADDFGLTNALDSGLIRVQYEAASSLAGTSVPDGTNIFRLRFKVLGASGLGSGIQITERFPTAFEVTQVQPDSMILAYGIEESAPFDSVQIHNGFVAIGYTVATQEPAAKNELPVHISPNPFTDQTTVAFHLDHPSAVHLQLTDVTGRVVRTEDRPVMEGDQSISISANGLLAHSTYFLTLQTATQACVQPLFLF
ncbi:MAG: cohesin domain-containing protein [Saprospiraceae bacterium]